MMRWRIRGNSILLRLQIQRWGKFICGNVQQFIWMLAMDQPLLGKHPLVTRWALQQTRRWAKAMRKSKGKSMGKAMA